LEGVASLDEIADEIVAQVKSTTGGALTKSEELGHQEFILTYKTFDPTGPVCMPRVR
jgi:altronate hydrolase